MVFELVSDDDAEQWCLYVLFDSDVVDMKS
jgi:hypothetical protein